jgi:hypothetical protein
VLADHFFHSTLPKVHTTSFISITYGLCYRINCATNYIFNAWFHCWTVSSLRAGVESVLSWCLNS